MARHRHQRCRRYQSRNSKPRPATSQARPVTPFVRSKKFTGWATIWHQSIKARKRPSLTATIGAQVHFSKKGLTTEPAEPCRRVGLAPENLSPTDPTKITINAEARFQRVITQRTQGKTKKAHTIATTFASLLLHSAAKAFHFATNCSACSGVKLSGSSPRSSSRSRSG